MLNPQALEPNWGGVLNLALGSGITHSRCLEIIEKLAQISQNKFYIINVYDTEAGIYLGDVELVSVTGSSYVLTQNVIARDSSIRQYKYNFYKDGTYERTAHNYVKITDLLEEREELKEKLSKLEGVLDLLG